MRGALPSSSKRTWQGSVNQDDDKNEQIRRGIKVKIKAFINCILLIKRKLFLSVYIYNKKCQQVNRESEKKNMTDMEHKQLCCFLFYNIKEKTSIFCYIYLVFLIKFRPAFSILFYSIQFKK